MNTPTTDRRALIREATDSDLPALTQVYNAYFPNMPMTVEQIRHDRQVRPAMLEARDFVSELDGVPVAFGGFQKAIWLSDPDRAFLRFLITPDASRLEQERDLLRWMIGFAAKQGNVRVYTGCCDQWSHHVDLIEQEGFTLVMRYPVTAVDLDDFDPNAYSDTIRSVTDGGLEIRSLAEISGDWIGPLHDLHCAVIPDVPHAEPARPMPRWMFEEFVTDPLRYTAEGKYVAIDGDRFVGVSEIQRNLADSTLGMTMLTGVLREYRRRGVATALKASALAWAKAEGMQKVLTDNHERNPMLDLNKQIGFREIYAFREYAKDL